MNITPEEYYKANVLLICVICGNTYPIKKWGYRQMTCSKECTYKLISERKTKERPIRNCINCGKEFEARDNDGSRGGKVWKKQHCSKECYWARGIVLYDFECPQCGKQFQSAERRSKYCSKACSGLAWRDENCNMWKGDEASYSSLHYWVRKRLGAPKECQHCHEIIENSRGIHWANVSGQYYRDITDWIRLCAKCHRKFDKGRTNHATPMTPIYQLRENYTTR